MYPTLTRVLAIITWFVASTGGINAQEGHLGFVQQTWNQIEGLVRFADNQGFDIRHLITSRLDDGEEDSWRFHFERGREYLITAVCDEDCPDIDLSVADGDGDTLVRDADIDPQPVVTFRPPYDGTFIVTVDMYSCTSEPCYFGLGLFESQRYQRLQR